MACQDSTMKISLVVLFGLAAVVATEALPARRMTHPVNVSHTWQKIMASQPMGTRKTYSRLPPGGRIFNGNIARIGQFPHQASVIGDDYMYCGGSLISPQVILTAGHCVDGFSSFVVHLGTLSDLGGGSGSVSRNTRYSVLHSQYSRNPLRNDIGLVKLTSPVTQSSTIKTIPLASGSDTYDHQVARFSGWGDTSDTTMTSDLMYVDLIVISNEMCAEYYPNVQITSSMLCTSGIPIGRTCAGDSGGALVFEGMQIGISSFNSVSSCEIPYPSGFTRVTSYINWINSYSK